MRPEEIAALGDLAGEAAAGTALQLHQVHAGIARRVWKAVGPAALPVSLAHDGIAKLAYGASRELARAAVRAGALAAAAAQPADARSIQESASGRALVGALNGVVGDTLERRHNRLSLRTTLRAGGQEVALTPEDLRGAFPHASSRLAVFIHGLGQTDEAWMRRADRHIPYGYRLQAELGYTPLYVRYNTGRHISDNARELALLLDRVTSGWPTDVHEIALVGHAMGGLVARGACHYGAGRDWTRRVRHVVTLGTPHTGTPLERLADAAGSVLERLPETRAVAKALSLRSAGMKDLRYGYIVEEDWRDHELASGRRAAREIPFAATADHYFVSAALAREAHGPIGRVVGDLLVPPPSAWGHRRANEQLRFPVEHYAHLGGTDHFALLNHPAIYAQIRHWLCSRRALPAPAEG
jgi:hypothetical protein